MERDGWREGWRVWGCFKPAVMSEPKQAGGGERRRGEGHVTLSGGIRSPSLSWNPYKDSEAWCSNRRTCTHTHTHTHTHITAITLLSVVNKRVRCTDYRHTTQAHTQPATVPAAQFSEGQHSLAARLIKICPQQTVRPGLRQQVAQQKSANV